MEKKEQRIKLAVALISLMTALATFAYTMINFQAPKAPEVNIQAETVIIINIEK